VDDIEKIVDFIINYTTYTDKKLIRLFIKQHLEYNTCDYEIKDEEVIYVIRWNVKGNTAKILDLIINPKHRSKGLFKYILKKNWIKFPYVKFLVWERDRKYPDRKPRIYNILELLRRK